MTSDSSHTWPTWTRYALRDSHLDDAIAELNRENRCTRKLASLRHRLLTGTALPPADRPKRWDEANVVELLRDAPHEVRIIDHGGYNSPGPWALARLGFRNVEAIDLNPRLPASPLSRRVRYSCQNMMQTAYADGSHDVIVSGSTVEHGVDWDVWLAECRRILRPGGLLYVSTDLVHDTVDTGEFEAFGLPWTPLRPKDLADASKRFGLHGFSEPALEPVDLPDRLPITFLGQQCGFIAYAVTAV